MKLTRMMTVLSGFLQTTSIKAMKMIPMSKRKTIHGKETIEKEYPRETL